MPSWWIAWGDIAIIKDSGLKIKKFGRTNLYTLPQIALLGENGNSRWQQIK